MSLSFLLYTHKHPPTGPGSLQNPNTPSNVKIGWNDIKYVHYVKKTTLKKKKRLEEHEEKAVHRHIFIKY